MTEKYIYGAILITIVVTVELKKYFKHKKIIGIRTKLKYAECSGCFRQEINGYILKKIKIGSGSHFIVKLDSKLSYQDRTEDVVIIKEKGHNNPIGTRENIEIHVYLPLVNLTNNKFSLNDFEHIGWATIAPENYDNDY
jgi:hypothetical protein